MSATLLVTAATVIESVATINSFFTPHLVTFAVTYYLKKYLLNLNQVA